MLQKYSHRIAKCRSIWKRKTDLEYGMVKDYGYLIIPEQFIAIGPPSFIWRGGGRGGGAKKSVEHFPEASAGGLFVQRFRRRFRPEEFSSAGDLLWRPTLRIRIRIPIRILIYRFFKYWGLLISDENSSGRSLWKVFHNFLRIRFAPAHRT